MSDKPNLKLAAIRIGDLLKWNTSLNEIDRIASGVFPFSRGSFPIEGITSTRAQRIYDWLMTLFSRRMPDAEKIQLLSSFLCSLAPKSLLDSVQNVLDECGVPAKLVQQSPDETAYNARRFHPAVVDHSKEIFLKGEYFQQGDFLER
jgi:hypothetical protein